MRLPGYTGEASLARSAGYYYGSALNIGEGEGLAPADLSDFLGLDGKKSTAWEFISSLPGAVADTFASGEAYQSYAQGQHAAVKVLSFGYFGDPEARARQLEKLGYKRPDSTVEHVSQGIGTYVIGPAVQMALFSWAWARAGLATAQVAWRPFSMWRAWAVGLPGHAYWGVGGRWVHAVGEVYRELLVVEEVSAPSTSSWILSGIPVLFPEAVVQTGGTAFTCITAAVTGIVRGWLPF